MIDGLKPYPAMKNSGVPWLGQVPKHWQVVPALAVYRPRQVKNAGLIESSVLSLSYGRIIVKAPEKLRGLVPESFETYQIVEPGNIIVRTTDLQNDRTSLRIGHAHDHGIITAAYMCLETKPIVLNEFGYQYLNAYDLLKIIYGFGSGLRQNLHFSDIKRMPVLVPPRDEQAAIVRFLDHADRRIRRYIRAKQKLIKLLEEQKQAIIHRAVTRGLDPKVRLKPSGVEWLGDVPEHWEVQRLGRIARVFNGTTPSRMKAEYWSNGTVPWLSSGKVNDYFITSASELVTERALHECSISLVPKGAVVIGLVGQGKTRGKSALLGIDTCINQNLAAIVPCAGVSGAHLHHFLTAFYETLREFGRGGNQEALNCEIVANWRLAIPPVDEQTAICDSVRHEVLGIQASEQRVRRVIEVLQEYRSRLITDVVTGKLDVRGAAARLPDEGDEPEPLDDTAADTEEEFLADDSDTAPEEFEA